MLESQDRIPGFWLLQLSGWGSYAAVTVIGVAPHVQRRELVAYESVFVAAAFLASFLLRYVCRWIWRENLPWGRAIAVAVLVSGVLAVACGIAAQAAELKVRHLPLNWQHLQGAFEGVLYAAFILISWSALYLGIKHYQAFLAERQRALQAEALAREARLQALKYQLSPHFLFNSLNAISTLISEGDSLSANRMLSRLAGFLRSTLDGIGAQQVTLAHEVAVTEQYLAIEQARLGSRLRLEISIAASARDALVPSLLLQPLAENAVRHGISPRSTGGTLAIRAERADDRLCLSVSDDGVGAEASAADDERKRGGIGLANTIERLRVLYGHDQRLRVQWPPGGGCHIVIELPYTTVSLKETDRGVALCAS